MTGYEAYQPHRPRRVGARPDDDQAGIPPVCVCDTPRFQGPCNCTRDHVVGECRGCHRIYRPDVPGFDAVRDTWRTRLAREAVA